MSGKCYTHTWHAAGRGDQPAIAQTLAEDVTAAMQGQLAADVLEGCNTELIQHCANVTPG
jgi:hypothetical protein